MQNKSRDCFENLLVYIYVDKMTLMSYYQSNFSKNEILKKAFLAIVFDRVIKRNIIKHICSLNKTSLYFDIYVVIQLYLKKISTHN